MALLFAPGLLWFLAVTFYHFRPQGPLPQPSGRLRQTSSTDWGRIVVDDNHCVLVNNTWNKAAAGQGFTQEIFLEDVQGTQVLAGAGAHPGNSSTQLFPNHSSSAEISLGTHRCA